MSTRIQRTELDILDDRIDMAWQFVQDTRQAWVRNRNTHREKDAEQAETELNRLLDKRIRLMAQRTTH